MNSQYDRFFEEFIIRAATFDERISDLFTAIPGQKSDALVSSNRLALWCQESATGNWSIFERRLSRDGLTLTEVLERFGNVRLNYGAKLPLWAEDAIWIDRALHNKYYEFLSSDIYKKCGSSYLENRNKLPFAHVFEPLIDAAALRLWSKQSFDTLHIFTSEAMTDLYGLLLKALCDLCAPELYRLFKKRSNNTSDTGKDVSDSHLSYENFCVYLASQGFRDVFNDKPVLLRLISVITRQWIDTSAEFIDRLSSDYNIIADEFFDIEYKIPLLHITAGLSDIHNEGRSVLILEFTNNHKIVYKPKDIRIDKTWSELVHFLNSQESPIKLKPVKVLAGNGYGWTEFIHHFGCSKIADIKSFFVRAGAWLSLFHIFAGSDMHQENIIASGDYPIPIDLEMLFQPEPIDENHNLPEAQADKKASLKVLNSVMSVGLLPVYGKSIAQTGSAIGGLAPNTSHEQRIEWEKINSNNMKPKRVRVKNLYISNLPHLNGKYANISDHLDNFLSGFEDYSFFLKKVMSSEPRIIESFARLPIRKLFRNTHFYSLIIHKLKNPDKMHDGIIWSSQTDFLSRLSDWEGNDIKFWSIQKYERHSLLNLNVPYFTTNTDGYSITTDKHTFDINYRNSGFDRVKSRIATFDCNEIQFQKLLISENTLTTTGSESDINNRRDLFTTNDENQNDVRLFLTKEADLIAQSIIDHAIIDEPAAAWIGLRWPPNSDIAQLTTLGPELYSGLSGIGIFFAAHAYVTKSHKSRELALYSIALIRKQLLSQNGPRMARSLGLGGATGLGSIIYALTSISSLIEDKVAVNEALSIINLITDDMILSDQKLDIMDGASGAILSLLRLYKETNEKDVLITATKCGEHLLKKPRIGYPGLRCWQGSSITKQPLTGFAHGAAGYAYALISLAAQTGRTDFIEAAQECIAYEDSTFDLEHSNWPDPRIDGKPRWPTQWCYGSPGIALSRIAIKKTGLSVSFINDVFLQQTINSASKSALDAWPCRVDTLCCGTLGIIEFLEESARTLERKELSLTAQQKLIDVIHSSKVRGDYRWNYGNRQFNLGLFRGLSGVGYTILRRIDCKLPNILMWE